LVVSYFVIVGHWLLVIVLLFDDGW